MKIHIAHLTLCTVALLFVTPSDAMAQDTRRDFAAECNEGSHEACLQAALDLHENREIEDHYVLAANFFDKGCVLGSLTSCAWIGLYTRWGYNRPRDTKKAIQIFTDLCERGGRKGCHELGISYFYGIGIEKDTSTARGFFEKECKADYGPSCYFLGYSYLELLGDGDDAQARIHLTRACELDNGEGCKALGNLLLDHKKGIEANTSSMNAYEKACNLGELSGCHSLGENLINGRYAPQDVERGLHMLEASCQGYHFISCSSLGMYYEIGVFGQLAPDKRKAKAYYEISCERDKSTYDCERIEKLDEGDPLLDKLHKQLDAAYPDP